MGAKKYLVVFEPLLDGHHQTLLRQYLQLFLRMDLKVILVCPSPQDLIREFALERDCQSGRLQAVSIPHGQDYRADLPTILRFALTVLMDYYHLLKLRQLIRKPSPTDPEQEVVFGVYFMFFGSKPLVPGPFWRWVLPVPWAALCGQAWRAPLRWRHTKAGRAWERAGMAGPRQKWCRKVFCWRGEPERFLAENVGPDKMEVIADSTDVRLPPHIPEWLRPLPVTRQKRFMVSMIGGISPRKGVSAFLEASRLLSEAPVLFVVAGQIYWNSLDPASALRLREAAKEGLHSRTNLMVIDQRIPDERDMNWLVQQSDICYLAYSGFDGSSNVLTKAAYFHVPSIVSEGTILAQSCREYRLGWVVPEDDGEAVAKIVRDQCEGGEGLVKPNFSGYSRTESEETLERQLRNMVAQLFPAPEETFNFGQGELA